MTSTLFHKKRRDYSEGIKDNKTDWLVQKYGRVFALIWYGLEPIGLELLRNISRAKLVEIAARLENIPDAAIWDAEWAGKFDTLVNAEKWIASYESRHAGKT